MGTLFKLQKIPTWKIPNGNIKKKKRCIQGSPTFLISSVSDHRLLGRGSKEATLGVGGTPMLGVTEREATRCFPPCGDPHEPWGQGWAVPSGWGQVTLLVGDP